MGLTRAGDQVTVLLDGEPVTYLVPLEVVRSSGGARLDYARFLYDLSQTDERIENLQTPATFNHTVAAIVNGTTIFHGWLHKQDLAVDAGEQVIVTASILPQEFGVPVRGTLVWDQRTEEYVTIPGDLLFNPLIDGVVEGNMSSRSDTAREDAQVWVDPESVRTDEAKAYRDESASEWVLTEALHSFTRFQRSVTTSSVTQRVRPPDTRGALEIDDDAIPIQNLRIPFGTTVPQALDLLTHPFGYDWYVDAGFSAGGGPQVRIYKRGSGTEKTVTMQAVGETLDLETTNCTGFRLSVDIGNRVNKLRLVGSRKQWEMGVELYRGWPVADDALTAADLDKDDPGSQYADKPDVWRLLVGNEAGDYSGTRSGGTNPIPESPRDWSSFGALYDTRRPAEDCLTRGPDGQRLPPQLEWSDDGGTTWQPVPESWHWSLLETQLGIRFNGQMPPDELIAAGDDAAVRLCCTLTFDECLEAKAAVPGRNAEIDEDGDVWQVLDVSDRYHSRQVNTLGDEATFVWESGMDKDERDDSESIGTAADYLIKEADGAEIDGAIKLRGILTDYAIGDLITSIAGRNIDLNRRARDPNSAEEEQEPRYLQVMGLAWRFGTEQETHLVTRPQYLDPWYQPGVRPDGLVGMVE